MTVVAVPMLKLTICFLFVQTGASFHSPCSVLTGSRTFLRTSIHRDAKYFVNPNDGRASTSTSTKRRLANRNNEEVASFDPFHIDADESSLGKTFSASSESSRSLSAATSSAALVPLVLFVNSAGAANPPTRISSGEYDPENFKPVCAVSDSFYRFLQGTTQAIVGEENFVDYGPLIAGGLLRIRLELCVVESFFNEAVGPFIKQNGLRWILPLHETVETFLAGTICAVATTFILVGSTKIVSVVVTYGDIFVGVPCRLLGGFAFDRALGKPVTLEIGIGPWKKQLVGPGRNEVEKTSSDEGARSDLDKVEVKQVPLLLVSGAVKAVGEVSKVSSRYLYSCVTKGLSFGRTIDACM